MKINKHVLPAVMAILISAAWLNNQRTTTLSVSMTPIPMADSTEIINPAADGGYCLDTKFFFPKTTGSFTYEGDERRQLLADMLGAYEVR